MEISALGVGGSEASDEEEVDGEAALEAATCSGDTSGMM